MGWVLTKGLQNLRAQMDAAFPERDKRSDGTVGDLAHQLEKSDHNPDRTGNAAYKDGDSLDEVRAWDMDSDLRASPATAQQVVDHIRKLPKVSSVLRYMIYNRKIYEASNGWAARTYTGPSAHTEHIHFSGQRTQTADSDTRFDYRLEEIPVSLTSADKAFITSAVAAQVAAAIDEIAKAVWDTPMQRPDAEPGKTTNAREYQRYNDVVNKNSADAAAKVILDQLSPKLDRLLAASKPAA